MVSRAMPAEGRATYACVVVGMSDCGGWGWKHRIKGSDKKNGKDCEADWMA